MTPVHVVILAAGEGRRMRSGLPKVLHRAAGRPLIVHVVRAALALKPDTIVVVVPPDASAIREALSSYPIRLAVQDRPRGTADAVAVGCRALGRVQGQVIVLHGDCPGILPDTLRGLLEAHGQGPATLIVTTPADPRGYGRIVRSGEGELLRIVEEAEAPPEVLALREVNAGVYCFDLGALREVLGRLEAGDRGAERYFTDAVAVLRRQGVAVRTVLHPDAEELHGVNTRDELARAEALLRRRQVARLLDAGVALRDPGAVYVDIDVTVGRDTVIYPGVVLEADTSVGTSCTIYPNVRVAGSRIGDGVTLLDGTVIEDSTVGDGARVGPHARLRPGSDIGPGAHIGNFVEVKNTRIGAGSKANHLCYLGDADIGAGVNVGAGTITCNYDGERKHRTVIEDGAFIGSNAALVAPVRIGARAYVAAGSTITRDVPAGALAVGRGRQIIKEGWAERRRALRQPPKVRQDA